MPGKTAAVAVCQTARDILPNKKAAPPDELTPKS